MKAYLSESERRRRYFIFRVKLYGIGILVTALGAGIFYVVRASDTFQTRGVSITGLNDRDKDFLLADVRLVMLKTTKAKIFGAENYFSWPKSFTDFSPYYKDVSVKKNIFRRTVSISASPRERFGAWCPYIVSEARQCRWIEMQEGILLDVTARPVGQLFPTISEAEDTELSEGEIFLPTLEFDRLKQIVWRCREINLSIQKIELNRSLSEIQVTLTDDALIRLSLRFDPATNLAGLEEMLGKISSAKIQELNLTTPGKIYLVRR